MDCLWEQSMFWERIARSGCYRWAWSVTLFQSDSWTQSTTPAPSSTTMFATLTLKHTALELALLFEAPLGPK